MSVPPVEAPRAAPPLPVIRALPSLVVSQIAAGEVIERPASVVKELLDNALDAGAQRITIEIEQGGIELVRISDDGHGMTPDQLPLALTRHATSKIRDASDLDRVSTMGFRGEALAAIASVSRLSIRSRSAGDAHASVIHIEGDTAGEPAPEAGPVGTAITVRNLFFNTPARRKFLRTPATEQGHCADIVRDLAMAHPAVGFTLRIDGRTTLELPRGQSPRTRALELLGRELEPQLIEADADTMTDARGIALWGLIGTPDLARPTARNQHVFVNGRPVRDKTIQHALREGYRGLIEPGRHPTAVLQLVLDPGAVDVNVHPAKAEVRFRDQGLVHTVVLRAVREALSRTDLTPRIGASSHAGNAGPGPAGGWDGSAASPWPARTNAGSAQRFVDSFGRAGGNATERFQFAPLRDAVAEQRGTDAAASTGALPGHFAPQADAFAPSAPPGEFTLLERGPTRAAMQIHDAYLVAEDEQGIVIIDQHALHERVMYEKLLSRLRQSPDGALESQRLLMPAVAQASPGVADAALELAPVLASIGLSVERIGPTALALHSFPTLLFERGVDPAAFLDDLLKQIDESPSMRPAGASHAEAASRSAREAALHEVLDMMACKAAVRAGDALSRDEILELLSLRESVERASNCPHGRPTSIRLTLKELERRFGRA